MRSGKVAFFQTRASHFLMAILVIVALLSDGGKGVASSASDAEPTSAAEVLEITGMLCPMPISQTEERSDAHPIAEAIAGKGAAYVHAEHEVFSAPDLKEKDLLGVLSGIVLTVSFVEENADQPVAIQVLFATEEGSLLSSYMGADDIEVLAYDQTVEAIGTDAKTQYQSAEWPLPRASFEPIENMQTFEQDKAANEEEPMNTYNSSEKLFQMLDEDTALAEPVVYPTAPGKRQLKGNAITVDISNQWQGYIMVRHERSPVQLKVTLVRDDTVYQFDLPGNGEYETLALTEGNGEYEIAIYERVTPGGDLYIRVFHDTIDVFMPDPLSVFRIPNQYVWFTEESALINKAAALCAEVMDDHEKVSILYNYVSERMLYDYVKAATITSPYLPDSDEALKTGRGICLDLASLLAGMLRAQGIPAQLVIGKLHSVYPPKAHAWNKVYLEGNWLLVDPTFNVIAHASSDYVERRVY